MRHEDAFVHGFYSEMEKTALFAALGRGLLAAGKWGKGLFTTKNVASTALMSGVGAPKGGMKETPKVDSVQSKSGAPYQAPGAP
jgi:hypothetical protein